MDTKRTTSTLAGVALAVVLVGVAWRVAGDQPAPAARFTALGSYEYDEDGYAAAPARHQEPDAIEAAFPLESYRPGATALLRIWTPTRAASIRVFHVGPEPQLTIGDKLMEGVPVTAARRLPALAAGQTIRIAIGDWPSGLYFAKVARGRTARLRALRRSRRSGSASIRSRSSCRRGPGRRTTSATTTEMGRATRGTRTKGHLQAQLGRPLLNRGVPPHYRNYDLRFLRWLHQSGRKVDVLSQAELDGTTGARLAQAYELIVFPGHHEYVTTREYDAVEGFRDRGGN